MSDFYDPYVSAIEVRNAAEVLEDATLVVCTITLPDGTTATPTVTNGGAGLYSTTYTPTQLGHHEVLWKATGTNACSREDVFNVARPITLISLAEAKGAVNFTGTDQDEELRLYVEAATDMIERLVGPIVPRDVTETVCASAGYLSLTSTPVVEVSTVDSATGSGQSYVTADLLARPVSGLVTLADGTGIVGDTYTVTYTAGRTGPIEARFLHACRLLVQHMWTTQRGSSSPGKRRGESFESTPGAAYSMPTRVLELLQLDVNQYGVG